MVPFASMIACLAAATTLSGVSFGQLIMTDLCGATAMAKVARSATEKVVIAKRILLGIVEEAGCGDYKCWRVAEVSFSRCGTSSVSGFQACRRR
jgi:hypothetical protein